MYIHIHTLLFKRPYLQRVFQLSTFVHLILIRGLSAKIKDLWPVLSLHKGKVSFVFISAFVLDLLPIRSAIKGTAQTI